MIRTDEDALTCDLAETYQIYDYQAFPIKLIAALAAGLRDDSRIKMRLAGTHVRPSFLLSAMAVDALNILVWQQTEDGHKGQNAPERIARFLLGEEKKENKNIAAFDTPEDFERRRKEIIEGYGRTG